MVVKPGVAIVSDIAAHHAEVLYGGGTRTVAALCDLAEICQAAVLNETLAVSPVAYHGSTLLQQLDFVEDPTPRIYEIPPGQPEPAARTGEDSILIDVDETGELTSDCPVGRLYLTHLAGEMLQASPILGPLAYPTQIPDGEDRGLFFLDRLPTFVFLLQAKKGAAAFDSEDIRRDLMERTQPLMAPYRKYATRVQLLQESSGLQPIFSCLEEPLSDDVRMKRALDVVHTPTFFDRFRAKVSEAIAVDRKEFFERWTIPPLGLMVLAQAKSLDDLPEQIAGLRDTFMAVRRELVKLEADKQAALNAGGGLDDRGYKEVVRIDQRIQKAFEAFDESLAQYRRSKEVKRSEIVFNMPKYLASLVSLGIGTLNDLIELTNLKRRNYLSYVPGLYKTASFIRHSDEAYIADIVERLLGRPIDSFGMHTTMLRFIADKVQAYSAFDDDAAPMDDDRLSMEIDGKTTEIPHSMLWASMVKDGNLRKLLLYPLMDGAELQQSHENLA
jgi:hypothetical protein